MEKTRFYLAGQMSGLPEFQYPRFNRVAARLRQMGHEVVNPAELDGGDTSGEWAYYLRRDLLSLLECEAIAVLSGWHNSKGATLEVHVAQTLGMPLYDADTLEPLNETILEEAQRLIHGDRQAAYGHPYDDFSKTAGQWNALFGWDANPEKVAMAMICVKLSRLQNAVKRDSLTDICGYAGTIELIEERKRDEECHP